MCWFGFTGGGGMPTPAGAGRRFRASQGLLWKAAGKSHDFAGIFPEFPGILTNLKSIRQRPKCHLTWLLHQELVKSKSPKGHGLCPYSEGSLSSVETFIGNPPDLGFYLQNVVSSELSLPPSRTQLLYHFKLLKREREREKREIYNRYR